MGSGIEGARGLSPEAAAAMREAADTLPESVLMTSDLVDRLRAAADALERAGEDTKRLDWLESRCRADKAIEMGWQAPGYEPEEYGYPWSQWDGGYYAISSDSHGLYDHKTLRTAIDAARAAGGTNG